jgi:manganese/zinc/iron transport system permease protein
LKTPGLALYLFLLFPFIPMEAAQVNGEVNLISKTVRFFSFSDYSVQVVVMGIIFMGVGCGLMGGFVVTRKLSLFGDTLSHAVLPWSGGWLFMESVQKFFQYHCRCHDRRLS